MFRGAYTIADYPVTATENIRHVWLVSWGSSEANKKNREKRDKLGLQMKRSTHCRKRAGNAFINSYTFFCLITCPTITYYHEVVGIAYQARKT